MWAAENCILAQQEWHMVVSLSGQKDISSLGKTAAVLGVKPRLSDQVFDYVVEGIAAGRYAQAVRITERELAEALGVSHVPVREAMERLQKEGWIEKSPRRGARVKLIDQAALEMLYQARKVIEAGAVRLVAEHRTEEQIVYLRSVTQRLENAFATHDVDGFVAADAEFHRAIVRFTGNTCLIPYYESIFLQS